MRRKYKTIPTLPLPSFLDNFSSPSCLFTCPLQREASARGKVNLHPRIASNSPPEPPDSCPLNSPAISPEALHPSPPPPWRPEAGQRRLCAALTASSCFPPPAQGFPAPCLHCVQVKDHLQSSCPNPSPAPGPVLFPPGRGLQNWGGGGWQCHRRGRNFPTPASGLTGHHAQGLGSRGEGNPLRAIFTPPAEARARARSPWHTGLRVSASEDKPAWPEQNVFLRRVFVRTHENIPVLKFPHHCLRGASPESF